MVKHQQDTELPFIAKPSGLAKLFICLALSIAVFFILSNFKIEFGNRIIMSWDVFSFSMIILYWTLFFITSSSNLESIVIRQDDDHKLIFLIVLIAVCFSVFGTLALMVHRDVATITRVEQTLLSLSPILFSWFLLHSIFTVRYAHLYHGLNKAKTAVETGGINFPAKCLPDYIDFAYFAFVIGMTFQVSDITITSQRIRRIVLMHSLISFAFNTIIVALSINTISNLSG